MLLRQGEAPGLHRFTAESQYTMLCTGVAHVGGSEMELCGSRPAL